MSDQKQSQYTEEELKKREELFRYTDLSHPVIQTLFDFKLDSAESTSAIKG